MFSVNKDSYKAFVIPIMNYLVIKNNTFVVVNVTDTLNLTTSF